MHPTIGTSQGKIYTKKKDMIHLIIDYDTADRVKKTYETSK